MEHVQPGWLLVLAFTYVFVILPICLWQGFHWMHSLEEHDEDSHGGH